jgi:hypothetical protein
MKHCEVDHGNHITINEEPTAQVVGMRREMVENEEWNDDDDARSVKNGGGSTITTRDRVRTGRKDSTTKSFQADIDNHTCNKLSTTTTTNKQQTQ